MSQKFGLLEHDKAGTRLLREMVSEPPQSGLQDAALNIESSCRMTGSPYVQCLLKCYGIIYVVAVVSTRIGHKPVCVQRQCVYSKDQLVSSRDLFRYDDCADHQGICGPLRKPHHIIVQLLATFEPPCAGECCQARCSSSASMSS